MKPGPGLSESARSTPSQDDSTSESAPVNPSDAPSTVAPPVTASSDESDAKALFQARCSRCHSVDREGRGRRAKQHGPSLGPRVGVDVAKQVITSGSRSGKGRTMPAFKDELSEGEIEMLAAYVRTI